MPPEYLPPTAPPPPPAAVYAAPVPPPDTPPPAPQFEDGVRPGDFVPYRLMPEHQRSAGRTVRKAFCLVVLAAAGASAVWWYGFRTEAAAHVPTCAEISSYAQAYDPTITLADSTVVPTGYPMPPPAPKRTCSATFGNPVRHGSLAFWPGLNRSAYDALLTGSGWTPSAETDDCTTYVDADRVKVLAVCVKDDLLLGVYARR